MQQPELIQCVVAVIAAIVGYFLRGKFPAAPPSTPPVPPAPPVPVTPSQFPILELLLKLLAERFQLPLGEPLPPARLELFTGPPGAELPPPWATMLLEEIRALRPRPS